MALADIRKKIEQEAADKAEVLLNEARSEADAINAKADARVAESRKYYDEQYEAEAPEVMRRAEIIANLDVKKIQLGAKQELIGRSFDSALDIICALPDAEYLAFMERLLDQAVKSGDEELLTAEDEKRITKAWLDKYNETQGRKLTLSAEHVDIRGGFLLRSGKIAVNCSLETLVDWLKEDLESDVVKRLFDAE